MSILLLGAGPGGAGVGGGGPPPTTDYGNAGGSGDRTASITVTTTATAGAGSPSMIVNGTNTNEYWWSGGESSREVVFDFGSGAAKTIDEFKWNQDVGVNHGTWVFGRSDDNISYTEFPESFLLGTANGDQTVPVTNAGTGRYYRLRQTAGNNVSTPFVREITFKIAG